MEGEVVEKGFTPRINLTLSAGDLSDMLADDIHQTLAEEEARIARQLEAARVLRAAAFGAAIQCCTAAWRAIYQERFDRFFAAVAELAGSPLTWSTTPEPPTGSRMDDYYVAHDAFGDPYDRRSKDWTPQELLDRGLRWKPVICPVVRLGDSDQYATTEVAGISWTARVGDTRHGYASENSPPRYPYPRPPELDAHVREAHRHHVEILQLSQRRDHIWELKKTPQMLADQARIEITRAAAAASPEINVAVENIRAQIRAVINPQIEQKE